MADKVVLKMFTTIFLFIFISNVSFSLAEEKKCSCYYLCNQNFTTDSAKGIKQMSNCERGCRFFMLAFHGSHDLSWEQDIKNAKDNCLQTCSKIYPRVDEWYACRVGCSTIEWMNPSCNTLEFQGPQISFSFLFEESDVLIHPGEPEPDDSLTDPGLRKQFQKTVSALMDATPKIPEIRFKNLPAKTEKLSEPSHANFKCPKFYGLDSKFEFRNGKIIIGDLYLFVGVFIFVVLCFLLGHHIETKNIKKQLMESKLSKKEFGDKEPLLKMDYLEYDLGEKESIPDHNLNKSEVLESSETTSKKFDTKIEAITVVFNEEDMMTDKPVYNYFKI